MQRLYRSFSNQFNLTALDEWAQKSDNAPLVHQMLYLQNFDGLYLCISEFGKDVNIIDRGYALSSHGAIVSSKAENVENEKQLRVDLGVTPLHIAAWQGDVAATVLLLHNGANILARTRYGHLPIHFAVFRQHLNVFTLLVAQLDHPRYQTASSSPQKTEVWQQYVHRRVQDKDLLDYLLQPPRFVDALKLLHNVSETHDLSLYQASSGGNAAVIPRGKALERKLAVEYILQHIDKVQVGKDHGEIDGSIEGARKGKNSQSASAFSEEKPSVSSCLASTIEKVSSSPALSSHDYFRHYFVAQRPVLFGQGMGQGMGIWAYLASEAISPVDTSGSTQDDEPSTVIKASKTEESTKTMNLHHVLSVVRLRSILNSASRSEEDAFLQRYGNLRITLYTAPATPKRPALKDKEGIKTLRDYLLKLTDPEIRKSRHTDDILLTTSTAEVLVTRHMYDTEFYTDLPSYLYADGSRASSENRTEREVGSLFHQYFTRLCRTIPPIPAERSVEPPENGNKTSTASNMVVAETNHDGTSSLKSTMEISSSTDDDTNNNRAVSTASSDQKDVSRSKKTKTAHSKAEYYARIAEMKEPKKIHTQQSPVSVSNQRVVLTTAADQAPKRLPDSKSSDQNSRHGTDQVTPSSGSRIPRVAYFEPFRLLVTPPFGGSPFLQQYTQTGYADNAVYVEQVRAAKTTSGSTSDALTRSQNSSAANSVDEVLPLPTTHVTAGAHRFAAAHYDLLLAGPSKHWVLLSPGAFHLVNTSFAQSHPGLELLSLNHRQLRTVLLPLLRRICMGIFDEVVQEVGEVIVIPQDYFYFYYHVATSNTSAPNVPSRSITDKKASASHGTFSLSLTQSFCTWHDTDIRLQRLGAIVYGSDDVYRGIMGRPRTLKRRNNDQPGLKYAPTRKRVPMFEMPIH